MAAKIIQLKKNLKKARNKAYNLEKTKTKIDATLREMKQENLINSKLQEVLQVFIYIDSIVLR